MLIVVLILPREYVIRLFTFLCFYLTVILNPKAVEYCTQMVLKGMPHARLAAVLYAERVLDKCIHIGNAISYPTAFNVACDDAIFQTAEHGFFMVKPCNQSCVGIIPCINFGQCQTSKVRKFGCAREAESEAVNDSVNRVGIRVFIFDADFIEYEARNKIKSFSVSSFNFVNGKFRELCLMIKPKQPHKLPRYRTPQRHNNKQKRIVRASCNKKTITFVHHMSDGIGLVVKTPFRAAVRLICSRIIPRQEPVFPDCLLFI
ncbi:hypothetical protein A9D60_23460 [Leisingera sp. JC1]|nr:hypothetical protein A9D60_23460 [Leisingera sp. JC1]